MQDAYKAWTRALYTRVNPHTSLPIKSDPTVAILQIQNEDSVFFWTFGSIPDVQKQKVGKRFASWLAKEYGSLEKATALAGANAKLDDFPKRRGYSARRMRRTGRRRGGSRARRSPLPAELQRGFCADMGRTFARNSAASSCSTPRTGAPQATTAQDIERWTYACSTSTPRMILRKHYQHKGPATYRIDRATSWSTNPPAQTAELTSNFKRVSHPFIVTETS
jgi:hypothetical protein